MKLTIVARLDFDVEPSAVLKPEVHLAGLLQSVEERLKEFFVADIHVTLCDAGNSSDLVQ